MNLPSTVNVIGITYKINYVDKPSDVDLHQRETLWGQVDLWTRTIRIYKNDRTYEDIMQTLWHEIIHAIANQLHIEDAVNDNNEVVDLLATGLSNVVDQNNWLAYVPTTTVAVT